MGWALGSIIDFIKKKFTYLSRTKKNINNMEARKSAITILLYAFLFLISTLIFQRVYIHSDLIGHANAVAQSYIEGTRAYNSNFLYYFTIYLASFGKVELLKYASILVLSLFVLFKFNLTYNYLTQNNEKPSVANGITTLMLVFSSAIYLPNLLLFRRFYTETYTLNVWHNSTTIFLMPFAILLFLSSMKQLNSYSHKRLWIILILILLNSFAKPHYLFVYVVALPITVFLYKKDWTDRLRQLTPCIVAAILIFTMKFLIQSNPETMQGGDGEGLKIIINPLGKTINYLDTVFWKAGIWVLINIVTGLLFPIVGMYFLKDKIKDNPEIVFSLVAVIAALLIANLFTETESRLRHGNFKWQIFPSFYIFFMVIAKQLLPQIQSFSFKKLNLVQSVFLMHFVFGCMYVLKIFVTGYYQ